MYKQQEILINAKLVGPNKAYQHEHSSYEFVFNNELCVIDCVIVKHSDQEIITPIYDPGISLNGMLFELHHVRVNPNIDNTYIVHCLSNALLEIGVDVTRTPKQNSMAMCFKPIGKIKDDVRFYLKHNNKIIFLSSANKPRLVTALGKNLNDYSS